MNYIEGSRSCEEKVFTSLLCFKPSYLDDDEYDSPPIILAFLLLEKMKTTYRTAESDSTVPNAPAGI